MVLSILTPRGPSSGMLRTASACSRADGSASAGTSNSSSTSSERSVNSQPFVFWLGRASSVASAAALLGRRSWRARPRWGGRWAGQSGSAAAGAAADSANRALHLQLDQAVHLNRVLHRELLGDVLAVPVDRPLWGFHLLRYH